MHCIIVWLLTICPGTSIQSQFESYQKLQKWYVVPLCLKLTIIRYGSSISEAIQGKELHPPLHLGGIAIKQGVFGLLLITAG